MAAARRNSESGVIIALVFFVVLAFAGIGCAIWFGQQLAQTRTAVGSTQDAFAETVAAVFQENGWELSAASPDELGVRFKREAFADVAEKLQQAAAYENQVKPALGWESIEGMKNAIAVSPAQQQIAAEGDGPFSTVQRLLMHYESAYRRMGSELEQLRAQNAGLIQQKENLSKQVAQQERNLREQLNDAEQEFKESLAKMRADYQEVLASFENMRQQAADWQQEYQQALNQHNALASDLKDQIAALQSELREIYSPGEREQMTPEGHVLSVDSQFDSVFIEGGQDKNVRENDTFVVYGKTPDGKDRMKGLVRVSQVYDTTSRASILQEDEVIVEDDYIVTMKEWRLFHGQQQES